MEPDTAVVPPRPAAPKRDEAPDGLLQRRLEALLEVIRRDFDGEARPLALANVMADRYRWPRLRTLADVRTLKARGLLPA